MTFDLADSNDVATAPLEEMKRTAADSVLPRLFSAFDIPIQGSRFPMRTRYEKAVDWLSATVRASPRWWEQVGLQVNNLTKMADWRARFLREYKDSVLSKEQLLNLGEFCFQQLRYLATTITPDGIRPAPVNGVFESDSILDKDFQNSILEALRPLEEVPKDEKDWRPGTNNQVLDLVDPSLLPLVYGLSRRINVHSPYGNTPNTGDKHNESAYDGSAYDESAYDESAYSGSPYDESADDDSAHDESAHDESAHDESAHENTSPHAESPLPTPSSKRALSASLTSTPFQHQSPSAPSTKRHRMLPQGEHPDHDSIDNVAMTHAGHASASQVPESVATPDAQPILAHFDNWKTYMGAGDIINAEDMPFFISLKKDLEYWRRCYEECEEDDDDKPVRIVCEKFQMLPTDIKVEKDGTVEMLSYINNMHPERHAGLYRATETLIQRCIPLFEKALAAAASGPRLAIRPSKNIYEFEHEWLLRHGIRHVPEWEVKDMERKYMAERNYVAPKIPQWTEPSKNVKVVQLSGRVLQVIIKYESIVLTPGNSKYKVDDWKVEGMENEGIVACAVATLRCDNITTSRIHGAHPRIAFRTAVKEPRYTNCYDHGTWMQYGVRKDTPLVESIGAVDCVQGRVVVFPNDMQQQIQPFKLKYRRAPGVLTTATILLVDPHKRIMSTSDVPPQQQSWHNEASQAPSGPPTDGQESLGEVPEFPVNISKAKELRERFLQERKDICEGSKKSWFEELPKIDLDETSEDEDEDRGWQHLGVSWLLR